MDDWNIMSPASRTTSCLSFIPTAGAQRCLCFWKHMFVFWQDWTFQRELPDLFIWQKSVFFHVFICFFFLFRCCFFFWYIFSLARVCVCVQVVSVNTRAGSVCTRKKTKAEASERCLNDIPKLGFKAGSARSFSLLSSLFFSYSLSRLSVCLILIFDYFLFFPGR